MIAAAHCVTSKSVRVQGVARKAVSTQCMATPPMPNVGEATVGSQPMKSAAMPPTAPSVKPSKSTAATVKPTKSAAAATTVKPTEATAPAMKSAEPTAAASGKRGHVRHDAMRAHRNACCQNTYRSLLHRTFLTRTTACAALTAFLRRTNSIQASSKSNS